MYLISEVIKNSKGSSLASLLSEHTGVEANSEQVVLKEFIELGLSSS